ncbi:DMT family transporter [Corynebacterium appendicis]|uniref:DMT family transporter n=1 Tax=Corynebacterium appendicis TaxID=163202 RepID=UPI00223B5A15|nr:DMT family transporter [Corynebacterium appendicis]MCT1683563.1 DMT family transporter [Corynebacterium appendicis]
MLTAAAMAVGAVIPAQTAVNSRLRRSIGAPIPAAFISFFVAFCCAVLLALVLAATTGPGIDLTRAFGEPWWVWIGGLMGVIFITGNVILFPKIGAVETVVLPILGQVIMALVIDNFGLFGAVQTDVGLLRVMGALVVVAGIVLVHVVGRAPRSTHAGEAPASAWAWRAFGVFMGMCSASQTAANGYLGEVLGSSIQAGSVNLGVGVILLFLLSMGFTNSRKALLSGIERGPWWMWLGGVFGAIFVIGAATLSPLIGTGATVIGILAGTIIAGQAIERFGLFGSPRSVLQPVRLLGLLLVFAGAVIVRVL